MLAALTVGQLVCVPLGEASVKQLFEQSVGLFFSRLVGLPLRWAIGWLVGPVQLSWPVDK